MCRLIAYLGPRVTLDALLLAPEHSLLHQSYAPRHQRHGLMNADGFGVGWYDHDRRAEPARYRTARPMWSDRSFPSLAGVVASGTVLAAVRSATPPAPVEESGTPPFTSGPWLFAHNGAVDAFLDGAGLELRALVSGRRVAGIEGAADSEVLFALALDRLDAGAVLGSALEAVVATVEKVTTARLNLMLTDGHRLAATACGNSLFVLPSQAEVVAAKHVTRAPLQQVRRGRGVVVASEPFDDDPAWQTVPDRSLVEADADAVDVRPLEDGGVT